jgi:hypothetical protein
MVSRPSFPVNTIHQIIKSRMHPRLGLALAWCVWQRKYPLYARWDTLTKTKKQQIAVLVDTQISIITS